MSASRLLRSSYLLYFSQPAAERLLYRAISGQTIRSIVELGIDLECRTKRILEVVAWRTENLPLRYTGIDQFDARPAGQPMLALKQAFATLRSPNVRTQLVPGDPALALQRTANSLAGTDLLLINAAQDRESLTRAWTWMPRMLGPSSLIFLEEPTAKAGQTCWRKLTLADVRQLAQSANKAGLRAA